MYTYSEEILSMHPTSLQGRSHQETKISIHFLSLVGIILLFPLLFPWQQDRKDVVSGEANLLLDLIGCSKERTLTSSAAARH